MEGSKECVLEGRAVAIYEALEGVVRERQLEVVEADTRHVRLGFTLCSEEAAADTRCLCAVLDAGHGLSKVVVVCFHEAEGDIAPAPDRFLDGLFVQVERNLHGADEQQSYDGDGDDSETHTAHAARGDDVRRGRQAAARLAALAGRWNHPGEIPTGRCGRRARGSSLGV